MALTVLQSMHPQQTAARSLETILRRASGRILLLLSGGSSLSVLEHVTIPDPSYTTLGLIDERYTIDPKDQNISSILEIESVQTAQQKGLQVISMLDTKLEMDECAHEYEIKIREWKEKYPTGTIIALMGIGEDGHTAGIMPHPEHPQLFTMLFENTSWVIGYNAGEKSVHPLRITMTNTFLRRYVHTAVIYAVGETKRDALAHLLVPFGATTYTPCRIAYDMKEVFVYTDLPL